ncbi:MAG: branched-chain amino acid ABC transporter permease [Anaerolineae bacterium]|nr:branched-chain amino acid ABC transporter permease [Anaerolineae bacterium]
MRHVRSHWIMLLILVALIAFPYIVSLISGDSPYGVLRGERYLQRGQSVYWQSILIEVFILAVLAMSYNILFGFTGVISFGHALFFGVGGYIMGVMLEKSALDAGVGLAAGFVIGIVVCGVLSFLIGLVSLRLRGVYFAMFTLAVAEAFFIYFGRFSPTGAEDGFSINTLPAWIDPAQSRLAFYYLTLALVVVTFLFIRRLIFSPTGAVLLAIRENEERAQAIGYNTLKFKLTAIVIAGIIACIAGMVFVIMKKKVGPEVLAINYTIDPLLMTIIGGTGTFSGPVIGAAALHLSDRLLRTSLTIGPLTINLTDSWNLILGIAFIAVVLLFPQGISGTWQRWRSRVKSGRQSAVKWKRSPQNSQADV